LIKLVEIMVVALIVNQIGHTKTEKERLALLYRITQRDFGNSLLFRGKGATIMTWL
jgi:hypothetical protein